MKNDESAYIKELADHEINMIKNDLYYLIKEVDGFAKQLKNAIKTVSKED
jgi:hypothetical protein